MRAATKPKQPAVETTWMKPPGSTTNWPATYVVFGCQAQGPLFIQVIGVVAPSVVVPAMDVFQAGLVAPDVPVVVATWIAPLVSMTNWPAE